MREGTVLESGKEPKRQFPSLNVATSFSNFKNRIFDQIIRLKDLFSFSYRAYLIGGFANKKSDLLEYLKLEARNLNKHFNIIHIGDYYEDPEAFIKKFKIDINKDDLNDENQIYFIDGFNDLTKVQVLFNLFDFISKYENPFLYILIDESYLDQFPEFINFKEFQYLQLDFSKIEFEQFIEGKSGIKTTKFKNIIHEAQVILNSLGYHVTTDGEIGSQTQYAIKDFQKQNNLIVDGEINHKTIAELRRAYIPPNEVENAKKGGFEFNEIEGYEIYAYMSYDESDKQSFNKMISWFQDTEIKLIEPFRNTNSAEIEDIEEIGRTIAKCDLVITLINSNSEKSEWINFEITEAKSHSKPILPIYVGQSKSIPYQSFNLQDIQWITSFNRDSIHKAIRQIFERRAPEEKDQNEITQEEISKLILGGLTSTNPEGNFDEVEDKLEFKNDIDAFANLIAYRKNEPPLAIGLFGDWGSGKSFFMHKLEKSIDKLLEDEKSVPKEESTYCKNIVHVKFNSWHYSDANLWASIVTEIFDTLNRQLLKQGEEDDVTMFFSELDTAKRQLQEINTELEEVKSEKGELEDTERQLVDDKKSKTEQLHGVRKMDIIKSILSQPVIAASYQQIKEGLNEEIAPTINEGFLKPISDLKSTMDRIKKALGILRDNKDSGFYWFIGLSIIGLLIASAGTYLYFSESFVDLKTEIIAILSSGALLITSFQKYLNPIKRGVDTAYENLVQIHKSWQNFVADQEKIKSETLNRLQGEIDILSQREESLKQQIKGKVEKINSLKISIADVKSGRKLAEFIRDRSLSSDYKSQLGIISIIRRDFEKIDSLLREQVKAEELDATDSQIQIKEKFQVDRIILYIDDLDRCSEERVVEVLAAIHLILAFKLFIVIVGVDRRWVSAALNSRYRYFLDRRINGNGGSQMNSSRYSIPKSATSYDYLEKIFQIPFALKKINKSTAKDLVLSLTEKHIRKYTEDEPEPNMSNNQPPNDDQNRNNKPDDFSQVENGQQPKDLKDNETQDEIEIPSETHDPDPLNQLLELSTEEVDYMAKLTPIIGVTPRTINRFTNVYLIIRSHRGIKHNNDLNSLIALMISLAIVVCQPTCGYNYVDTLGSTEAKTFGGFLRSKSLDENCKSLLKSLEIDNLNKLDINLFKNNLNLIKRFSFRTL